MQRLQMCGQTGFLSSKSVQQVWLSRSVQTDDTDRNEFLFHFTELVKCSRINFHLMTMKVLNKAERLRPVTTLQSSQTHWCIDITVPQLLYAYACDTYCFIRRWKKNYAILHVHYLFVRMIMQNFVCLFVCLRFNGTFSTNRLYRTITVR